MTEVFYDYRYCEEYGKLDKEGVIPHCVYENFGLGQNPDQETIRKFCMKSINKMMEINDYNERMKKFCNFLYLLYKVFEKDAGTDYSLSELNYFGYSIHRMGKFFLEHKDKDLAIKYFEAGAIIMNGDCCFELAKIYEQYKEFNKALNCYEELEYIFNSKGTHIIGYQTAYMKLLIALNKIQELKELIENWQKAESMEPYRVKEFNKIYAQYLFKEDKYKESACAFEEYLSNFGIDETTDPNEFADICNRLSIVYYKIGDKNKSKEYLKKSADLNFPDAMYKWGRLLYNNDKEKGISYLVSGYINMHLNYHAKTCYFLGCYYMDNNNWIDADIYMRRAYQIGVKRAISLMAIISKKMSEIYCLEAEEVNGDMKENFIDVENESINSNRILRQKKFTIKEKDSNVKKALTEIYTREVELFDLPKIRWERGMMNHKEMWFAYFINNKGNKMYIDNDLLKDYRNEDYLVFTVNNNQCDNINDISFYYNESLKIESEKINYKEIELLNNSKIHWEKGERSYKDMWVPYIEKGNKKVYLDNSLLKSYYYEDNTIINVGGNMCTNIEDLSYYYNKVSGTKNKKAELNLFLDL